MRVAISLSVLFALIACSMADDLSKTVELLTRQLMMQQLAFEEKTRAEGQSGVKQVRIQNGGTRPYFGASWAGNGVTSIHDHANNIRTVGMGEFVAVLNGVEFRTRHNDYRLNMPSPTSRDYNAVEPIPFPSVPKEVTGKATVEEQIIEMREFFRAWKEQNETIRDYKPYFRANICYLEGAWTTSTGEIEECFDSDRHFIDAKTWFDLNEKARFTAYSGRKSPAENYAFLPTKIMGLINDTIPDIAQWNYRVLCQPLEDDLPLHNFRVVDDLVVRMKKRLSYNNLANTRSARFQLNPYPDADKEWPDHEISYQGNSLLDVLMKQVPGKDNGLANITDDAFDILAEEALTGGKLNSGFYHRRYELGSKDAMGLKLQRRGFSDDSVFMAQTTNPRIAAQSTSKCKWRGQGKKREKICDTWTQRWSWAVPMEIIYLTPLNSWNPYNLEYKGDVRSDIGARTVARNADGSTRTGALTPNKAYNGTNSKHYFITPAEFYSRVKVDSDAADTSRRAAIGVLDKDEQVREVRASGTRTLLPNIAGLGQLRMRYPIMPMHDAGNPIMKEIEALKDIVLRGQTYSYMVREKDLGGGNTQDGGHSFLMSPSNSTTTTLHTHSVELSADEIVMLTCGETVTIVTSQANNHEHILELGMRGSKIVYKTCDEKNRCWDKHPKQMEREIAADD